MREVVEIRWHARGGQGAVTASKLLAEMALENEMYFQAFPEYGPERMGAPIQCFNRLSRKPLTIYCGVTNPDLVVVVDPTLVGIVDFTAGLSPKGMILVNTPEEPRVFETQLPLKEGWKVWTVDATKIAWEEMGQAMPNTPMLGALIHLLDFMPLEKALAYIESSFQKKFGAAVTAKNLRAVKRAYEEVKGA